jgi:hypothetical protein
MTTLKLNKLFVHNSKPGIQEKMESLILLTLAQVVQQLGQGRGATLPLVMAAERPEHQGMWHGGGASKIADVHGRHVLASNISSPHSISLSQTTNHPTNIVRCTSLFGLEDDKPKSPSNRKCEQGNSPTYTMNLASSTKLILEIVECR